MSDKTVENKEKFERNYPADFIVEYHKSVDDFLVVVNIFYEFTGVMSNSLSLFRFFDNLTYHFH